MNMLARDITARNHRLRKDVKPVPVAFPKPRRHVLVYIRPDASQHVRAYRAWLALQDEKLTPYQFVKAKCVISNITTEQLFSQKRAKYLVDIRHAMIREAAERWPNMSSVKLGHVFHRDHTVILYAKQSRSRARKNTARLTKDQVVEIKRRLRSGNEMAKDIAKAFNVSAPTISAIARGRTWRDGQEKAAAAAQAMKSISASMQT